MSGILYVVATPIGNLEDVTFRAVRVLREVSLIAAEDTRRTARILQHYSISTPTTSLHEHNEHARTPGLIRRLSAGESIALVSDAGTPVVSDPGAHLVSAAHAHRIRVEPVPGANAGLAALSASGLQAAEFVFLGFPPEKAHARKQWLAARAGETRVLIVYEAPHRIRATLSDMLAEWGDRIAALGRELTKAHEKLVVAPISAHLAEVGEGRGEYTLVVSGGNGAPSVQLPVPSIEQLLAEVGDMTKNDRLTRRAIVQQLALKYGLAPGAMYKLIEEAKKLAG
ncbi:MAG: 16S rRNA (cytidine(1402)-2'-O)-methyltransferase [Acidobacteria bacterium]|nr:16S rRNA (cytidine(1402)-2'-O)-methyltransferase [Acidobacteriota bacterium]MCA1650255.1 16S rRNA (cytidine(1402)-2'-O)-methyltransferase [Acidobacteriota bacterium]